MEKLIIFGLKDISEIAFYYLKDIYEVVAFTVDKDYMSKSSYHDLPVVDFENIEKTYSIEDHKFFIPLGYTKVNKIREEKYKQAKEKGFEFISYISPKATVAENAKIGDNCFIFEDNTIQPFVTIEDNCILWSGNHIGHHSTIKANCFITSHVVISGGVEVGENTFVGVNATFRDHIKIGKHNVIGAAALIMSDTEDNSVYISKATEVSKVPSNKLRKI